MTTHAIHIRTTPGVQSTWLIQHRSKSYYVTTYPDSDLIYVETDSTRRRPVKVGAGLKVAIQAAIVECRERNRRYNLIPFHDPDLTERVTQTAQDVLKDIKP